MIDFVLINILLSYQLPPKINSQFLSKRKWFDNNALLTQSSQNLINVAKPKKKNVIYFDGYD